MTGLVVSDSTCLIGLERINHLHILQRLYGTVVIPLEVSSEFGHALPWITVETVKNHHLVATLKVVVDAGEAEAIALALETNRELIIDDRHGRHGRAAAKRLGLKIIGTVGLLVRAKRAGIIPSVKTTIEHLETNGFFISDDLREQALRLAGE